MISSEERAWALLRRLDVEYVVVSFAGLSGVGGGHDEGSDDVDNFMNFVNLSASLSDADLDLRAVDQSSFLNGSGRFTLGKEGVDLIQK